MAEQSYLWDTNGTGDGSGSGISEADFHEMFMALTQGADKSGVSPDIDNELAASGTASPVSIATGRAIVHGSPYRNTAAVAVTIPTPTGATRIDRIVLRKSWAAQTVRITRIAGTEGGSFPDVTQTDGVTWDFPLCRVSITTGGVVTLTDERQWLNVVGDSGVSTVKIADSAVTTAKLADSNVTAGKLATDAVTTAKLANSQVTADKLATDAVTTAKLADDAVTNAKAAHMAQSTIKGRAQAAGTGDPTDLTAAQVRTLINVADGANAYTHPNHSGDVTSTADGATVIANDAVTNAKMANMAQNTVKGRITASTGDPEDLTAAQMRTLLNVADGADVTATVLAAAAAKTALVGDDAFYFADSEASNALKKGTLTNLLNGLITVGSFTPGLLVNGSSTGITYSSREGRFFKFGPLVHFGFEMVLSSKGAGSGALTFTLPYAGGAGQYAELPVHWHATASSFVEMLLAIQSGATGQLYGATAAGITLPVVTAAMINNTTEFLVSGTYLTDL